MPSNMNQRGRVVEIIFIIPTPNGASVCLLYRCDIIRNLYFRLALCVQIEITNQEVQLPCDNMPTSHGDDYDGSVTSDGPEVPLALLTCSILQLQRQNRICKVYCMLSDMHAEFSPGMRREGGNGLCRTRGTRYQKTKISRIRSATFQADPIIS